jgi:ATP-dependent Lon protease
MRVLAQWISNPDARGNCIGIQGPMGCGKTNLCKEGLCKALNLPFGFISLGGASDASFLEGHGFTYEGSTYGKIAEILMKTKCMNPILFFDELDKVSHGYRGDEIIGILTHLTDSSQNERFNDRYFGEIDLNLSKALFIFSYNDESLINPILKDRMITIRVNGYTTSDKICIARDYLIPELLKDYKRNVEDIVFNDDIIEKIIHKVTKEEGVRNLKRGIESIISWLNMHTYLPIQKTDSDEKLYTYPITITDEHIANYIKEDSYDSIKESIARTMYL